jgi:hypothetical protein
MEAPSVSTRELHPLHDLVPTVKLRRIGSSIATRFTGMHPMTVPTVHATPLRSAILVIEDE